MRAEACVRRVRVARLPGHYAPNGVSARLARTRKVLAALTLLGIAFRLAMFETWGIVYDGAEYAVMGHSLLEHGEFIIPSAGDVQYYRHYGPAFPTYLAAFFAVFGFSVVAVKIAELVATVLFLVVVHLTTRDLLGPWKAWFATAYVALEPMFLITSAIGYEENLVGLLFVSTVWAVVKSLKQERYLVLAGILAGLGFLAKASVGYVFVIAALAGILWRIRFRGVATLGNRWYLAGMSAFAVLAGGWSLRNIDRFGWPNWQTSASLDLAYRYGLAHPDVLAYALLAKVPWFALMLLFYAGVFLPELRRSARRRREEATSALWLAVLLVFVMGWIVTAFFSLVESFPIWWHDNLRYVVIASPVLLWAALREVSFFRPVGHALRPSWASFRNRFLVLMAVFVGIGLVLVALPAPYAHVAAFQEFEGYFRAGDVVGVDGLSVEMVVAYLAPLGAEAVRYGGDFNGSFVLSATAGGYPGFAILARFSTRDLMGHSYACDLWGKRDSSPKFEPTRP
jgi:4-amino-4-deoxy-L-arabinose transferase-like glycosyltransferase